MHGFIVTGVLLGDLGQEALGLVFGIVKLGVGVGDLAAADKQLEAVGDIRVLVVAARQGRHFERILGDKVRLLQLALDQLFENHHLQLAQPLVAQHLGTGLLGNLARLLDIVEIGLGQLRVVLEDGVIHGQANEGLAKVEHLVAVRHVGGAQHRLRQLTEQLFGQVHVVAVVRVGLIELEHGEFRVVAGRDALVAEVAVDLEDLLKATHNQTLEVQLRRDTQEHRHIQRVVVGFKGFGRCATRDGLQHRGFNFEEAAVVEKAANVRNHLRTNAEGVARFFVDDQINIALTVALFGVGQTVVLVRQRTQGLGQQLHAFHVHIEITFAGASQRSFGGDDVAQVPGLDCFQGFCRQALAVNVDLQTTGGVLQHHEGTTVEHDATGNLDRDGRSLQLFLALVLVGLLQVGAQAVAAEVVREGDALLAHRGQFGLALGNQLVFFLVLSLQVLRLVGHIGESRKKSIRLSARRAGHGGYPGGGLQPLLQAGLDKLIKVAVKHRVAVAVFDAGTQILDA